MTIEQRLQACTISRIMHHLDIISSLRLSDHNRNNKAEVEAIKKRIQDSQFTIYFLMLELPIDSEIKRFIELTDYLSNYFKPSRPTTQRRTTCGSI